MKREPLANARDRVDPAPIEAEFGRSRLLQHHAAARHTCTSGASSVAVLVAGETRTPRLVTTILHAEILLSLPVERLQGKVDRREPGRVVDHRAKRRIYNANTGKTFARKLVH